jgi:hypothetical protein
LPVGLYFDHNVSRAIVQGLRLRGVDVVTALEDGAARLADPELLDRSSALGRVLVSSDEDLILEARRRQHEGTAFGGVIFAPQSASIGGCIDELELVAKAATADELSGTLLFLPLRR